MGCAGIGSAAKGALSPEFIIERQKLVESFQRIESVAKEEVELIRQVVRSANEREKDLGTGILIGALVPYVSIRAIAHAEVETEPSGIGGQTDVP
jgi:hypothetical protein